MVAVATLIAQGLSQGFDRLFACLFYIVFAFVWLQRPYYTCQASSLIFSLSYDLTSFALAGCLLYKQNSHPKMGLVLCRKQPQKVDYYEDYINV